MCHFTTANVDMSHLSYRFQAHPSKNAHVHSVLVLPPVFIYQSCLTLLQPMYIRVMSRIYESCLTLLQATYVYESCLVYISAHYYRMQQYGLPYSYIVFIYRIHISYLNSRSVILFQSILSFQVISFSD